METLLEILTQYAEENLVSRLLRENTPQIQAANLRADQLAEKLAALAPETEESAEKLKLELDNVHFYREQAFLLAGVSIGLKLGRL